MIVVAIIGILAAVALPAYQTYTEKARFSEVPLAVGAVRGSIDACYQTRGQADLANCDTWAEIGYTEAQAISGDQVTAMAITLTTAVIQGTGANGSTFTLTPVDNGTGSLVWTEGGTCIANGHC